MTPFIDLKDEQEDDRIDKIGRAAMATDGTIAFVTDAEAGKLQRYLMKLFAAFPELVLHSQGTGPARGVVWAKVRRR